MLGRLPFARCRCSLRDSLALVRAAAVPLHLEFAVVVRHLRRAFHRQMLSVLAPVSCVLRV